jgi:rhodanese-related sulfurtransferase
MSEIVASLGELDQARETVVICHHGIRSLQVALYMEHQGFSRVINLQGGVAAWTQEVDPAMPLY